MPKVFGPLDEERLRALVDDDSDLICSQFDSARYALSRNDIGHGLQFLFAGFPACDFFAYLEIDKSKRDPLTRDWYINFGGRPFKHLLIVPDPNCKASVRIYEDKSRKHIYQILGRPDQWQELLKWVWDYGQKRRAAQAAKDARARVSRNLPKSTAISTPGPPFPNPILHRTLQPPHFKSLRSVKSKRHVKPSPLGKHSDILADVEEELVGEPQAPQEMADTAEEGPSERQVLQEKDPNGQMAAVCCAKHASEGKNGLQVYEDSESDYIPSSPEPERRERRRAEMRARWQGKTPSE